MEVLVFIPGIMGSELLTPGGETVWPPTPLEVVGGYHRTDKLVRPDLVAGGVIRSVCIDVYAPLLDAMNEAGYGDDGERRLRPHPYDWRRDLAVLSDELDTALSSLVQTHGPDVQLKLVCHSMGGLVARGCLEKPRAAVPSWADAVKLCVFLATPHDGAPLAFARAIGVGGGSLGLSAAQLRQVAGAAGFPAGYQLFPPSDLTPIWTLDEAETPFRPISLFAPEVDEAYGLNDAHLHATQAFRARLDPARKPAACRYFSVVSAAHETVTRFDQQGGAADAVKVVAAGDGTVPITSAAALRIQTAYVKANHMGVAQHQNTHALLEMLLGVRAPEVIAVDVGPAAQPTLSLSDRAVSEDEAYEIVIEAGQDGRLAGRLHISRQAEDGGFGLDQTIDVAVSAPGAQRLSLRGPALAPGSYRFELRIDAGLADSEDLVVMRQNA
jgi:hypothetical protein